MNLYAISDLHLEFSNWQPPEAVQADVIILAGDIWKKDHGIHWARSTWPDRPIIYVAGNHEYYGSVRESVESRLEAASRETGVHYLQNKEVQIEGVRFLGCTLWTDFRLFGNENRVLVMRECVQLINDFRVIREGGKPFSPVDAERLFHQSYKWLNEKLDEPFTGKTIVVTHHLPSAQLVAPEYENDVGSAAFASRADELLGRSALWIAGHTHTSFDLDIKGTRVVVNPRGYTTYSRPVENYDFNPSLILEV